MSRSTLPRQESSLPKTEDAARLSPPSFPLSYISELTLLDCKEIRRRSKRVPIRILAREFGIPTVLTLQIALGQRYKA